MVAVKARMVPAASDIALLRSINRLEREFKSKFPVTTWLFFEPDTTDDN